MLDIFSVLSPKLITSNITSKDDHTEEIITDLSYCLVQIPALKTGTVISQAPCFAFIHRYGNYLYNTNGKNDLHKLTVVQLLSGQTYKPKRVYLILNERISNVVADYRYRTFMEFLPSIAQNLHLYNK
ncbi:hypothetical protein RF11_12399 [Thelohanellus kitauei]|uniref:Uncharacterized protein n=1 Tax=Thelohanellus kitauei TaxID=669202 RepID=A0A0C2J1W4_THEKT|nr:hypothetical protein RF11_12399 [Thelohanellus kitauei]